MTDVLTRKDLKEELKVFSGELDKRANKQFDEFGFKLFKYLDKRFDEVDKRIDGLDEKYTQLMSTLDTSYIRIIPLLR